MSNRSQGHRRQSSGPTSSSHAAQLTTDLQNAVALHQRGLLAEAEKVYRNILNRAPANFDATHLLGVISLQRQQFVEAEQLISKALEINPSEPVALSNRGSVLLSLGRLEDALVSFTKAVAIKPDYAEAFYNRGVVLQGLKRFEEALTSYERAIALRPNYAEALNNRGGILNRLRRFSLQKDLRAADAEILNDNPQVTHLGQEIETFADTAAIMTLMDVVISSDTSVVHLAGALGAPIWILLQFVPDWRWLLDRDDSPWYPTARLFRQDEARNWDEVIARVRAAVRAAFFPASSRW